MERCLEEIPLKHRPTDIGQTCSIEVRRNASYIEVLAKGFRPSTMSTFSLENPMETTTENVFSKKSTPNSVLPVPTTRRSATTRKSTSTRKTTTTKDQPNTETDSVISTFMQPTTEQIINKIPNIINEDSTNFV